VLNPHATLPIAGPSVNAAGACHPSSAATGGKPAKRQAAKSTTPDSLHRRRPKTMDREWIAGNFRGKACKTTASRVRPPESKGGATVISSKMLNHVDGQQFLVEGLREVSPLASQIKNSPRKKKLPARQEGNRVHGSRMKTKPSPQVQDPRPETTAKVQPNRTRTRIQIRFERRLAWVAFIARKRFFSWASPSAGVARGSLALPGMQRCEECDQCGGLRRTQILPICGPYCRLLDQPGG